MRCSVVIPTYNRADLLAWTLHALAEQDLDKDDFEVLVVDDGSSDHTRARVAEFESRLHLRYFFQPDEGYRVAKARNVGIAAARGDVCVLVDSGVLLARGALRAHCEAHETSARPLAVCGYVYAFNEDNEDAVAIRALIDPLRVDDTIAKFRDARQYADLREEFYAKYGDDFNHLPAPWLVYWTCNVSARRTDLVAVGMFDENFQTWGGEDVELAYRLHRHGCAFALVRAAASIHYPHDKSYERNMADARTSYRYFAAKYGTPITALVINTHFFALNDVILHERLPSCEEFTRRKPMADDPKLVVVFAPHPDDEVIATGGTIARHREAGDRVIIVYATDGSESHAAVLGIHADPSPAELTIIRQGEALEAAAALGVPAGDVVFLHRQDTQLANEAGELAAGVEKVFADHRGVSTVYLPDPDRELNADHRMTGQTVLAHVRAAGLTPRLLKYTVWDREVERAFEFANRLDAPAQVDDSEQVERIDIRNQHRRKLDAMAKHRTQVELFSPRQTRAVVPDELKHRIEQLTVETFRVHAWEG